MSATEHPYAWAVDGPPLGVWRTALGSASALVGDVLTLTMDGTGTLESSGALRGEERLPLLWRHLKSGHLELVTLLPGESAERVDDDMWEPVRYGADWLETDAGPRSPILRNLDRETFWTLSGPVQLAGRSD